MPLLVKVVSVVVPAMVAAGLRSSPQNTPNRKQDFNPALNLESSVDRYEALISI